MSLHTTPCGAQLVGVAILATISTAAHTDARQTELFNPGVVHAEATHAGAPADPAWYEGFGDFGMEITTSSREAQQHFDQGIGLLWGFNHAAAVTAFRAAQDSDPDCALCYWAEAYALGPNLNDGMHPENEAPALAAANKAAAYARTPREAALSEALRLRYAPESADQATRDAAFAEAMTRVVERFPADPNLLVIKSDALMNLQPWDYWEEDGITHKGNGAEILATLERAIELAPEHPAALHLYIHAAEASVDPGRAEAAADTLRGLVPAAGHLVHMPAHIYNRVGRYADSIAVNQDAIAADERYLALAGDRASTLYRFGYYPHNVHFLLVGAQNAGLKDMALDAANKLAAITSDEVSAELAWVQAIRTARYSAHVQFSDLETVMALPDPGAKFPYVQGFWRFARGSALAAAGEVEKATAEFDRLQELIEASDFSALEEQYLPARDVLGIAASVLGARIKVAEGDFDAALASLDTARVHESNVPYMEPPYWPTPVARTIGATLLAAGRPAKAAKSFEEALAKAPRDGWALWGLAKARAAEIAANPEQADTTEIATLRAEVNKAWLGEETLLSLDRL